ncbi:MAG: hypothetical protein WCH20_16965, partial [Nitrospira sp.]
WCQRDAQSLLVAWVLTAMHQKRGQRRCQGASPSTADALDRLVKLVDARVERLPFGGSRGRRSWVALAP